MDNKEILIHKESTKGITIKIKFVLLVLSYIALMLIIGTVYESCVHGKNNPIDEKSTIIPMLQEAADSLLKEKLTEIEGLHGQVIVMEVQTGEIVAMVGLERNFEGKYLPCKNFAYQQW